jgi:hypothetical protein
VPNRAHNRHSICAWHLHSCRCSVAAKRHTTEQSKQGTPCEDGQLQNGAQQRHSIRSSRRPRHHGSFGRECFWNEKYYCKQGGPSGAQTNHGDGQMPAQCQKRRHRQAQRVTGHGIPNPAARASGGKTSDKADAPIGPQATMPEMEAQR